jgi:hypothetical protein
MLEEAFYVEDSSAPKHKRARVSQVRKVVIRQSHGAIYVLGLVENLGSAYKLKVLVLN